MPAFIDAYERLYEFNTLLNDIKGDILPLSVTGISESQRAHFIASTLLSTGRKGLVVVQNPLDAKALYEDLSFFMEPESVMLYPAKDYIFYNIEASDTEIIHKRLAIIESIINAKGPIAVIASIDAALQYTVPPSVYQSYTLVFTPGERHALEALSQTLTVMGYQRADTVEGIGQFNRRGGILDIFPPNREYPYRIEFFDDEVDTVRTFDPTSQLSIAKVDGATVICSRECVYDLEAAEGIAKTLSKAAKKLEDEPSTRDAAENIRADIVRITESHYFPSIDKLIPLIYKDIATVATYFNEQSIIFADYPSALEERAEAYEHEISQTVASFVEKGLIAGFKGQYIQNLRHITHNTALIGMGAISASAGFYHPKRQHSFTARNLQGYQGRVDLMLEDLRYWHGKGYSVAVLAGSRQKAEAFCKSLKDDGIEAVFKANTEKLPPKGSIMVYEGSISRGFEYPQIGVAILSGKEIFGSAKKHRHFTSSMPGERIKSFSDLSPGDYVVHYVHGVGRYLGLHRIEVDGVIKDYIKIAYKGSDYLYIPASMLDTINKYIGGDREIKLNKMGGAEFAKTKNKVKKSVEELAQRLVELYASRRLLKGYAFGPDTDWQSQFEDTFPYDETADQLRCITEAKKDMESEMPMDRLLCGDVGFGKTEVALRAAFKAVMDGKQVAYLVPTTILAQQHYNTFVQRMKDFPVAVEMLSRFRGPKQQKEIIKRLTKGQVDIVIGTHRLLQRDLVYRNLGLLIIDEEQRFGVSHKERIKEMKKDVDVLTLTATPIPRTLHMALMGIRDMSVIAQPPEDRYPVQTFVLEYDKNIIRDAIIKEIGRGGQVYYVYNRIDGIHKVANTLIEMLPDAKIAVAHGQMSEIMLEKIMLQTLNGEIDVLICTTIIETGLDIPNINTIIIENSDCLGLSQLYQLRGRVGRSNRLAYAYLTYRKDKSLNENAVKRLVAIREFTEFGSGFKIALRDLEIRGAGNVLGPEQHGVMEAVGYDMYCRILEEAVAEAKGEPIENKQEATVDLSVDAYIPEDYIDSHNIRIDLYKGIAAIENQADAGEAVDELIDRFGEPPQSVLNLIDIAVIKAYATACNIIELTQKGNKAIMYLDPTKPLRLAEISQLAKEYKGYLLFSASAKPYLSYNLININPKDITGNIKIVLHHLKELQEAKK